MPYIADATQPSREIRPRNPLMIKIRRIAARIGFRVPLVRVLESPGAGQFSFDAGAHAYGFHKSDHGINVSCTYVPNP